VPTKRPQFKKRPKAEPMTAKQIPAVGNASLKQAATLIGLSTQTLVSHSKSGIFPGQKIGGVWKFPWPWVREKIGMTAG
jgi:hypothetical protein